MMYTYINLKEGELDYSFLKNGIKVLLILALEHHEESDNGT